MGIYIIYLQSPVHLDSCDASQDVVDGPGPGAFGGAGLRLGAPGREGGGIPQARRAAAGLHRGQTVHDAGEALQTGGTSTLIAQNLYRHAIRTLLNPF